MSRFRLFDKPHTCGSTCGSYRVSLFHDLSLLSIILWVLSKPLGCRIAVDWPTCIGLFYKMRATPRATLYCASIRCASPSEIDPLMTRGRIGCLGEIHSFSPATH